MSKSQRDKGKRGERELVQALRELGVEAERNLNTTSDADAHAADIILTAHPDWIVDAKLRGQMPPAVFREVEDRHGVPFTCKYIATVWRTTRDTQWRVTMTLEDWTDLLKALEERDEREEDNPTQRPVLPVDSGG